MKRSIPMRSAGLLWLHWLSLDAVMVLVTYQWVVAQANGVSLPPAAMILFGLGIWPRF